tara:strand:- start:10866 stop:11153 length:288 start_codon:yes stop_codon:yes gene_type:complete
MHGAWGGLSILIKRQEAAKFRKAALRAELKNRKESYIHNVYDLKDEFDFPEISHSEMQLLKEKIRNDFRKKRRKEIIIVSILCLLFTVIITSLYL